MTSQPAQVNSDFRSAMRRLAAGVAVITTCNGDEPHGMTATAVSSLALDPASLLICVNRSASVHDILEGNGRFCVNLLSRDQAGTGQRFASKPEGGQRFENFAWSMLHGLPYLHGIQAGIFCTQAALMRFGTHTIFVGTVDAVELGPLVDPLVYLDGNFLP